jgi:electron transfer flavoprotein alpha subunit
MPSETNNIGAIETLGPNNRILVYLESDGLRLTDASKKLARAAIDLADQTGNLGQAGQADRLEIYGTLLVGPTGVPGLPAFSGLGLSKVLIFKGQQSDTTGHKAAMLVKAVELCRPDILLVQADERGREVAPMVAARLGTGLTADCTSLRLENGLLVQTRPAFGGNLMAEIITPKARPQMATVRAAAQFQTDRPSRQGLPILELLPAPTIRDSVRVLKRKPVSFESDLEKASVVIAVGLGLGGPEGMAKAEKLALKLGASLGATRAVVDRGWLPADRQIGLSGRNISPNLLITLGVSGSVQFMAGVIGVKNIIAVNNDPKAPIFVQARVGLVIEIENLWPELDEQLGVPE